jgi:hypothetical protein
MTRGFFSKWRQAVTAGAMSILGMTPYLYLPLASMTNPPSNWGYARSVEGFVHVLTRGQYERLNPTKSFSILANQMWLYLKLAVQDIGWIYLLVALIPFCYMRRMRASEKSLMLAFVAFHLCLSVFMMILLNPPPDRQPSQLIAPFLSPSYLVAAIWSGWGLMLLGTVVAKERIGRGV